MGEASRHAIAMSAQDDHTWLLVSQSLRVFIAAHYCTAALVRAYSQVKQVGRGVCAPTEADNVFSSGDPRYTQHVLNRNVLA